MLTARFPIFLYIKRAVYKENGMTMRTVLWGLLAAGLVALGGCKHEVDTPEPKNEPIEVPEPDEPDEPDLPDPNKTYAAFKNLEVFPVEVYKDPDRTVLLAQVPPRETVRVETAPSIAGTAFYPRFYLTIEDVVIPCNGPGVTTRIDEKKVNTVSIPPLTADEIESPWAYVKISNESAYSLTFNRGSSELLPMKAPSTIIVPEETAVYQIEPMEAAQYAFMRNTSAALAFPSALTAFEKGFVYVFTYTGSDLSLDREVSITQGIIPVPLPSVSAATLTSITLTWAAAGGTTTDEEPDAATEAVSYKIYRSGIADGDYTLRGTTAIAPYTDTGLTEDTVYYYRVSAVYRRGESVWSKALAAQTLALPPAPQQASAQAESVSTITITWEALDEAESYKVYRADTEDGSYTLAGTTESASYTDTDLAADTAYFYKITTVNGIGESAFSEAVSVRTLEPPPAPQNASALADSMSSITITWEAVDEVESYKVYRADTEDGSYTLVGTTESVSYTDTALAADTAYFYKITTVNGIGESAFSEAVSARTLLPVSYTVSTSAAWTAAITAVNTALDTTAFVIEVASSFSSSGSAALSRTSPAALIIRSAAGGGNTVILSGGLTLGSGVSLLLEDITLQGQSSGSGRLLTIAGGSCVMGDGAAIQNNRGGGVYVGSGSFTMEGGTISGNSASSAYGGGVYIESGTFTMNSGTISGNTVSTSSSSPYYASGGGVYVAGGRFTMNGGTVSGNFVSTSSSSSSSSAYAYGGGVYVGGGSFTMSGGTISGNSVSTSSSSSYAYAYAYGGGVYVGGGSFTMSGGTISGNTASASYSYVYHAYGGGVSIGSSGRFTKTAGVIYGSNGGTLKNTAADGGQAVYTYSGKQRNTTAGTSVSLDSALDGSAGGWE
jgi:fibronectin type 3 domain-containing protein